MINELWKQFLLITINFIAKEAREIIDFFQTENKILRSKINGHVILTIYDSIHLLVIDTGKDVIARSMQLVAGRVGQEFNQWKNRSGAFWEDRYHAIAIMKDSYLLHCLVYIDLN